MLISARWSVLAGAGLLLMCSSSALGYLHTSQGRFMQRDPMGYVDGMSTYQVAKSNTVNARDPSGRSCGECMPPAGKECSDPSYSLVSIEMTPGGKSPDDIKAGKKAVANAKLIGKVALLANPATGAAGAAARGGCTAVGAAKGCIASGTKYGLSLGGRTDAAIDGFIGDAVKRNPYDVYVTVRKTWCQECKTCWLWRWYGAPAKAGEWKDKEKTVKCTEGASDKDDPLFGGGKDPVLGGGTGMYTPLLNDITEDDLVKCTKRAMCSLGTTCKD